MNRFIKQLSYGLLFLLIAGIIVGGVVYFFWPAPTCFDNKLNQDEEDIDCGGQNCISCDLKNNQPLKVSSLEIFDNGNKTVTVLGEINNSNLKIGAEDVLYTINLIDRASKNIFSKTGKTFVYPGKNRTVIEAGIDVEPKLAFKGELKLGDIAWQPEEWFGEIVEQKLAISKTAIQEKGGEFILSGTITNNNAIKLDKVIIKAVLLNKDNLNQGASLTLVENLAAFGSSNFTIHIPVSVTAARQVDPNKTKIIIEAVR